jgi:hypothetical protein
MRFRQQWLHEKIFFIKKQIMEISLNFQSMESNIGIEQAVPFIEMKYKVAHIVCRFPRCDVKFSETSSRIKHERNKHPREFFSCGLCNLVVDLDATIKKPQVAVSWSSCIQPTSTVCYYYYLFAIYGKITNIFFLQNN